MPIVTLGISGVAFELLYGNAHELYLEQNSASVFPVNADANSSTPHNRPLAPQPLPSRESTQANTLQAGAPASQKQKRMPGIFRGDWGETPVYSKNDRVNYARGAYLSLADDNQDQPPDVSLGFWRLLRQFKAVHEENCFSPAPGLDMGECDFTELGSLKDRDLHDAVLTKARLNGELGSANLSGANLSRAAVIGSLVISPNTRLDHADLSHLQSDGNNPVIAEAANLSNTNFTKANLYGAKLQQADLTGAKLTEAILTGSQLASARFNNTDLNKADMAYSNLSASTMTNAVMTEANLEQADLSQADLSNANLQKANFAGSQLAGTNFSGADLRGVNLSAAQGADTAIIDSQTNFTAAICPDGVTVDGTQVTTCVGHGF